MMYKNPKAPLAIAKTFGSKDIDPIQRLKGWNEFPQAQTFEPKKHPEMS